MAGTIATSLIIGLCVGIVVGALGAGGGILSVPVLVYLLGQEPHAASAGSLVIVGLTALTSLIPRAREGHVQWKQGLIFGALSCVGTFIGSRLSVLVNADLLMILFSILLVVVGILMLRKAVIKKTQERAIAANTANATQAEVASDAIADEKREAPERRSQNLWLLIGCATVTGLLTGFFGVGGGFAVVPMLVLALGFTMREASSTSLLVMIIASAVGLLSRVGTPVSVDWVVVATFAIASMLGGLIGAPASTKVKETTLTTIFGILLLVVAVCTFCSTVF